MSKIKIIILIGLIITLISGGTIQAVDGPETELILGAGLMPGTWELNATIKGDNFGLAGNYASLNYSYQGHDGNISLIQIAGRYYSPITYENADIYLEAGIGSASYETTDDFFSISSPAYHLGAGFNNPIAGNFGWGMKAGYLFFPPEELNSQFYAGISINIALPISTPDDYQPINMTDNENGDAEAEDIAKPSSVTASGSIDGTSVPYRVSGNWNLDADFNRNTARFSVSGSSRSGPFSYTLSGSPEFSNGQVIITTTESTTHDGQNVTGDIRITVNPDSMSLRISARRADGVRASASVSGTTSSYRD